MLDDINMDHAQSSKTSEGESATEPLGSQQSSVEFSEGFVDVSSDRFSEKQQSVSSLRRSSTMERSGELQPVQKALNRNVSERLSQLTINKLKFENMGVIGRDAEIHTLSSRLERMMEATTNNNTLSMTPVEEPSASDISTHQLVQSSVSKELIYIEGFSGVGKSALARTLCDTATDSYGGVLCEGKFSLSSSSDQPYEGIAKALGELCQAVVQRPKETVENVARGLHESLMGDDIEALSHLIPELEYILTDSDVSTQSSDGDTGARQERWKYAIRTLTRVLSTALAPIVIFLDDLQWADLASLQLMENLISDVQNPNPVMMIGCYRSDEFSDDSLLAKSIRRLEDAQTKFGFAITNIQLNACQVEDVNKMIMTMMSIDDDELNTKELAELCFKRTHGNPFFVIEFMTMLQRDGLIKFNLEKLTWVWNVGHIEAATMSTSNVVMLLQARMRQCSWDAQLLLQIGACLGQSFRRSTLEVLWNHPTIAMKFKTITENLTLLLEQVQEELLIEMCGPDMYRWVHDKVQESAMCLLKDVEGASFQFELGSVLYASLSEEQLAEELFNVADLVNRGETCSSADFAELNHRAAIKAKSLTAFQSAAKYASKGIAVLPIERWTAHRQLSLHLYTIGAEMEFALGRAETAELYSQEILLRPEFSLVEALPLKLATAASLCAVQLKFEDTIDYCIGVLKELGYNLVWYRPLLPVQAITTMMRSIKAAKKLSEATYRSMNRISDPKHRAIARLLSQIAYAAYNTEDLMMSILVICKLVEFTLEFGLSESSPKGLASLGNVAFIVQQDYDTSSRLIEMALTIQKILHGSQASETIFVAYNYAYPFTKPLQVCVAPFAEGYKIGLRTGQIDFAMWNLFSLYTCLPYVMGKPLIQILDECPKIVVQMEEVSQNVQALCSRIFWQMAQNLSEPPKENADKLEGDFFSAIKNDGTGPVVMGTIFLAEMQLLLFSDFEKAADLAISRGDYFAKTHPANFVGMIEAFHRGVALYVMARRTKKAKYAKPAKAIRKFLKISARKGNPNINHYVSFLNAEQAALERKYDIAEESYKNAIVFAAKTGHLHHAALLNERYADFLLEERGDETEAKYRAKEAMRFYLEWGAMGKVEQMKNRL